MLYKISIIILLLFTSTKVLSQQDSLKTKNLSTSKFAIVEIYKDALSPEKVTIYYDDMKEVDITNKLYNINKNTTDWSDLTFDNDFSKKEKAISISQRALLCIKYMAENNYTLVSSTYSNVGANNVNSNFRYSYQYVFEKRIK
jgi:hypothetical protein